MHSIAPLRTFITRPLTGWLRQNSENSSGTDEDCAFRKNLVDSVSVGLGGEVLCRKKKDLNP
jgi:hypothetical protein